MTPLIGFGPDLDPTTPGVITDCSMLIPSLKGMKSAPSAVSEADALAAECRGASVVRMVDDTFRVFAATQTEIYELNGTSWTDQTASSLTGSAESRTRFAQFGNITIACNRIDNTLKSTGTGIGFSALSGAPKASYIDTVAGFVMVADYNDGVNDYGDGWYCSGLQDYTTWTPSVSTQCANGRLLDSPGPIRGIKRLGQNIIAYKERSMYIGTYAGPPIIWQWQLIPGEIGAASQEAIVSIDTAHIFIGEEDIYLFDGSRPVAIGNPIREWFFADLNPQYRYKIQGMHDRENSCVHFYYPSGSSTTLDSCIIYNYKANKWGKADRNVEAVLEYISGGGASATYDADTGTFDDATGDAPFDSMSLVTYARTSAIVDTTHTLCTLTGTPVQSTLTTGDIGDDLSTTIMLRVSPRFITNPTSATLTNYYRMNLGDSLETDQTVSMSNNRFDFLRSARWHRFMLTMNGNAEVIGANVVATDGGAD